MLCVILGNFLYGHKWSTFKWDIPPVVSEFLALPVEEQCLPSGTLLGLWLGFMHYFWVPLAVGSQGTWCFCSLDLLLPICSSWASSKCPPHLTLCTCPSFNPFSYLLLKPLRVAGGVSRRSIEGIGYKPGDHQRPGSVPSLICFFLLSWQVQWARAVLVILEVPNHRWFRHDCQRYMHFINIKMLFNGNQVFTSDSFWGVIFFF